MNGKPFALLGINSDENLTALKKIAKAEQITWRNWWDDGRRDGPIQTDWQVIQRPTIHLIDAKGVIRYKNVEPEALDDAIDVLLAEIAVRN